MMNVGILEKIISNGIVIISDFSAVGFCALVLI